MTYAATDDEQTTAGITAAITAAVSDDASYDLFKNIATSDSSLAVAASIANSTPEFDEGASTERFVRENRIPEEGTAIGGPVLATDDDEDTLAYTLGGRDAAMFDIDGGTDPDATPAKVAGQLRTKAALNYETKKTYMVTVTAHDGTSNMADASASIDVTIHVTNVDEAPSIVEGGSISPNNPPEFASATASRTVAENTAAGEDIGTPVAATDDDADDTLAYTLGGADVASFDIDLANGQIMTKAALDFETKVSYSVTVTASDGTAEDTITVTITVTDVDERTLLDRYDHNNSGRIDKSELADGVFDYEIGGTISKDDLADLIFSYEIG